MRIQKAVTDIIVWRGLYLASVFFLNIVMVRYFGASFSGYVFLNIAYLSFFILLSSLSLESGLGFYLASDKMSIQSAASTALGWCFVVSLLAYLFFVVVDIGYSNKQIDSMATLSFVIGSTLISFFSALFFAKKKFREPNIILAVVNFLLIGIFLFFYKEEQHKKALANVFYFSFLIQGVLLAAFFLIKYKISWFKFPLSHTTKIIFKYSLLALLSNAIFFLVSRAVYWFVDNWSTDSELGNYIQVSKLQQWFLILPAMLATVVFPLTASGSQKMDRSIVTIVRCLLVLSLLVCIIVGITGKFVFPSVFGNTFDQMYLLFILHIPGMLALAGLAPLSAYHAGQNQVHVNLIGGLLALLVVIVGNIILVRFGYSVYIASVISSIAFIINFIYSLLCYQKRTRIPAMDFFKISGNDLKIFKRDILKRL